MLFYRIKGTNIIDARAVFESKQFFDWAAAQGIDNFDVVDDFVDLCKEENEYFREMGLEYFFTEERDEAGF